MKDILVFDIETKNDFLSVGGRENLHLLEVSVIGFYSYNEDRFFVLNEHELDKLDALFAAAGLIIGFNIIGFDLPVIAKHLKTTDIKQLRILDLMDDPKNYLKFRPSLSALATATLKKDKTADGLEAIKMYREGRMEELAQYCLEDVRLTRDLFDYGKREGKVLFFDTKMALNKVIPVSWGAQTEQKKEAEPEKKAPPQRSLF